MEPTYRWTEPPGPRQPPGPARARGRWRVPRANAGGNGRGRRRRLRRARRAGPGRAGRRKCARDGSTVLQHRPTAVFPRTWSPGRLGLSGFKCVSRSGPSLRDTSSRGRASTCAGRCRSTSCAHSPPRPSLCGQRRMRSPRDRKPLSAPVARRGAALHVRRAPRRVGFCASARPRCDTLTAGAADRNPLECPGPACLRAARGMGGGTGAAGCAQRSVASGERARKKGKGLRNVYGGRVLESSAVG